MVVEIQYRQLFPTADAPIEVRLSSPLLQIFITWVIAISPFDQRFFRARLQGDGSKAKTEIKL